MDDTEQLARQFEDERGRLRAVAYRILGSAAEADDAVQEAWLRLARSDAAAIENLGAWLTTVVSRICLNLLQSRTTRRELPLDAHPDAPTPAPGPEDDAVLADSLGPALLLILETLTPPERLAFVLHDLFGVSFGEIARILDRTPAAARQLASRARRRVQGGGADTPADRDRQREVVAAFLVASREGDFAALLTLLDPDVVLRADPAAAQLGAAAQMGGEPVMVGASAVATFFDGRAKAVRLARIDGAPGGVWAYRGRPATIFDFTIVAGRITAIELLADPELLGAVEVEYLRRPTS
jgi:RNA polymerase sigma factor (sigma-70 family)